MKNIPFKIHMNRRLFSKKLNTLFPQFDALQTYRDPETGNLQGYQGIPTNYGAVCFHAIFDEDNLESYYLPYLTDKEHQELDEKKATDRHFPVFQYLVMKELIYDGGPIPINHPEFIILYYVQVSLTIIDLSLQCSGNIEEDIKQVERRLTQLKMIQALSKTHDDHGFIDYERSWQLIEFDDEDETEAYGYSLGLTLELPSEMTLKDAEKEIDTKIEFLKEYINRMPRSDELFLR
jgi:hypothetical protein